MQDNFAPGDSFAHRVSFASHFIKHTLLYDNDNMHTHEQIRARHRRIESDLEREEKLHEKYAPLQKY